MVAIAVLILTVYFNSVPVPCVVDTGSMVTTLSATLAEAIPELSEPLDVVRLQSATGQVIELERRQVASVATTDLEWTNVQVVVVPADQPLVRDCILGLNVLGQQPLVFNWQQQTIAEA